MLAMPYAIAGLGILGGLALTAAVAVMTYASIAVMLRCVGAGLHPACVLGYTFK